MVYLTQDFHRDVSREIQKKTGYIPTQEQCKAVAHHMEYNIRADTKYADNGHLKISWDDLMYRIVSDIKKNLHANDVDRYVEQYRRYKSTQLNNLLTETEEKDLQDIARGNKKVSDFTDKDYLKNLYIKYFNQKVRPDVKQISLQEINHLKYHGFWHTEQVALFAIDISVEENMNPLPNLLAAALHDCARSTDGYEPKHSTNCEPIARNYLDNKFPDKDLLSPKEHDQIIDAVTHHNVPFTHKDNTVLKCLQDADGIRLWWEKRVTYDAHTPTGKQIAAYPRWKQIKYLSNLLERMRATMPNSRTWQNTYTYTR